MEKVEGLVDQARHLALHEGKSGPSVKSFHSSVDSHLEKIHSLVSKSAPTAQYFLTTIQHDLPAADAGNKETASALESADAFRSYMKSADSNAQGPAKELDLAAPISDYFISSSHNTYLTGNQLYSDAAASAYTNVLLRGCRSVEIDVWDGELETPGANEGETSSSSSDSSDSSDDEKGSLKAAIKEKVKSKRNSLREPTKSKLEALRQKAGKAPQQVAGENASTSQVPVRGEPRVLHGHTLTKGTTFREICYAIRDSAFVDNDLPIIVSFEVHACLEQQQLMVDIMKEAWKGLLVELPPGSEQQKPPTLGDLKRKILIKTKTIPPTNITEPPVEEKPPKTSQQTDEKSVDSQPPKPSTILEALSEMAIYTRAYHFSNFDQPEAKVPFHIFSLSEKAARDAHINHREALFAHNRSNLMRIYPFALRVSSSNPDPPFYWRRGAQLVSLNWQNLDKGMMLNTGMFSGTHGWELKPTGYRSTEPASTVAKRQTLDLTIEVFAAQDLALPPGDHREKGFRPYLNCQLHVEEPDSEATTGQEDISSDSEKSSYKRCTKSASGKNPDFGAQRLVFATVTGIVEELSFIRFKIKDDEIGRDELAAWTCIRLDRLREGYRLVHLHDCTGEKTGGVLLVNIMKRFS
ncbi:hypothetical protein N7474_005858 [Penicillium riverlandense]|uniref:uncharacterized protein n=1 Tax=Penicillium riverlandense TaxID=1903569 RepID=UPI0025476710|nr:uncharacterized protein N7474_005858 [Penicillium riverlandense]KAJ5820267.1 hypothetical protein N7474_005858 [Penicillium riverlandense]